MNHTRPFIGPSETSSSGGGYGESSSNIGGDGEPSRGDGESSRVDGESITSSGGDLNFDKKAESYYKSSTSSLPTEITTARTKYYTSLPETLSTTRALSRGLREPTKDEKNFPPKTEVELRAERMKKESRWRRDLEGWEVVRPDKGVVWDERFRDALKVFVHPPKDDEGTH